MSIPVRAESEIHLLVQQAGKRTKTVGRYVAGPLLGSANPSRLWAFCGLIGIMATLGFVGLNKIREARAPAPEPAATD